MQSRSLTAWQLAAKQEGITDLPACAPPDMGLNVSLSGGQRVSSVHEDIYLFVLVPTGKAKQRTKAVTFLRVGKVS